MFYDYRADQIACTVDGEPLLAESTSVADALIALAHGVRERQQRQRWGVIGVLAGADGHHRELLHQAEIRLDELHGGLEIWNVQAPPDPDRVWEGLMEVVVEIPESTTRGGLAGYRRLRLAGGIDLAGSRLRWRPDDEAIRHLALDVLPRLRRVWRPCDLHWLRDGSTGTHVGTPRSRGRIMVERPAAGLTGAAWSIDAQAQSLALITDWQDEQNFAAIQVERGYFWAHAHVYSLTCQAVVVRKGRQVAAAEPIRVTNGTGPITGPVTLNATAGGLTLGVGPETRFLSGWSLGNGRLGSAAAEGAPGITGLTLRFPWSAVALPIANGDGVDARRGERLLAHLVFKRDQLVPDRISDDHRDGDYEKTFWLVPGFPVGDAYGYGAYSLGHQLIGDVRLADIDSLAKAALIDPGLIPLTIAGVEHVISRSGFRYLDHWFGEHRRVTGDVVSGEQAMVSQPRAWIEDDGVVVAGLSEDGALHIFRRTGAYPAPFEGRVLSTGLPPLINQPAIDGRDETRRGIAALDAEGILHLWLGNGRDGYDHESLASKQGALRLRGDPCLFALPDRSWRLLAVTADGGLVEFIRTPDKGWLTPVHHDRLLGGQRLAGALDPRPDANGRPRFKAMTADQVALLISLEADSVQWSASSLGFSTAIGDI